MNRHQQKILKEWDAFDSQNISTERLFAMVEAVAGVDAGEISEALYKRHMEEAHDGN